MFFKHFLQEDRSLDGLFPLQAPHMLHFIILGSKANQILPFYSTCNNRDDQDGQECHITVFLEKTGDLIDFFPIQPPHINVLESLGQKKINYCNFSQFGLNQDNQSGQECLLCVFFKKIGV